MTRHELLDWVRFAHIIEGVVLYFIGWWLALKRWKNPAAGVAFTILTFGQFFAAARAGYRDEGLWVAGSCVVATVFSVTWFLVTDFRRRGVHRRARPRSTSSSSRSEDRASVSAPD